MENSKFWTKKEYTRQDYEGRPSTLCKGCGHNSISNMIISACYELKIPPGKFVKFSGIGCSSKSTAYFLEHSFGVQWLAWKNAILSRRSTFC